MKKRLLGSDLEVSAIGLGCMGMSEFYGPKHDSESLDVLDRAVDLGVRFLDTSDMYGSNHNENLIGRFLKKTRYPVKIATKFGIVRESGEYNRSLNNSPDYARKCCEGSLKRLGIEKIDLYYVHRINPNTPIEETILGLEKLKQEGKIGHIGLCEVSEQTLRRAHAVHPITAIQTEYSLWSRDVEKNILPTCEELGIGFVPYSPLGRGFLSGLFKQQTDLTSTDARLNLPRFSEQALAVNLPIVQYLSDIATKKDCTLAQLCLAWLLAKGDNIVPIPGTKRIEFLEQNVEAQNVQLNSHDILQLDNITKRFSVMGERYTKEGMKGVNV